MNSDYKKFEKKWFAIFIFMYILIMIPFPFFYSEKYRPSVGGIPIFIMGWFAHTFVTFILIFIYSKQALSRKEYQESYYLERGDNND